MIEKPILEQFYEENKTRFLKEWDTFLRFKSISTDPNHDIDCEECACWLVDHLSSMGINAELLETPSKPVVFGHFQGKEDFPTIVYYGHYDVQPVDPVELWDSPPFEPKIRSNRLYARGAQDNKGQTFYFLKAVETLIQKGALNCSLRIFIEGEEETGSDGIAKALPLWEKKVAGDVLMVCDTGAVGPGIPTITMGLRGIVHFSVKLSGINHDLHSGSHGGMVKNPALELARLLATLHDEEGKILVEGFYNDVPEISTKDRQLARDVGFNESLYEQQVGVRPLGGETEFSPIERKGFRPTIEVNGIHSGYGGPGSKTIIPNHAIAKLSVRLVGKQDPETCLSLICNHLKKYAPESLKLDINEKTVGGPALLLSSTSPLIQKAERVLSHVSDQKTVFSWEGGSIPIVANLATLSGAEPLLVGFGLEEDQIHAPNESFDLAQFHLGFLFVSLMLSSFSDSLEEEKNS